MLFFLFSLVYYDAVTDLFNFDATAFWAGFWGALGGLLGTYLRNILISSAKPNSKKEGFGHYVGWFLFGTAFALTVHSLPVLSLIVGLIAPSIFKGLGAAAPGTVEFITSKIPLLFAGKKD